TPVKGPMPKGERAGAGLVVDEFGRVSRRGGHTHLEAQMRTQRLHEDGGASNIGFATKILADGSLAVGFTSNSVNRPRYEHPTAPEFHPVTNEPLHQPVVDALRNLTGREVRVVPSLDNVR